MRYQKLAAALLGLIFSLPIYASSFHQGAMAVEGRAGASIPVGDMGDYYNTSFMFGGSFLYGLSNNFVLNGDVNYNTNFNCSVSGISCKLDLVEITAGARYLFSGTTLLTPYAGAGAGIYTGSGSVAGFSASGTDFGVNYGGGVLINVHPKVALDLGGRFNTVFESGDNYTYLSLSGGLIYFFS